MNNIGILYPHVGEYDKAIDYYQRILQRTVQRPDTSRMRILAKLNIGFAEYSGAERGSGCLPSYAAISVPAFVTASAGMR